MFLLGLFYPRTNSPAAVAGLGIGTLLGFSKLTVQALYGAGDGKLSEPQLLAAIGDFHFLYTSGILFLITIGIVLLVSHLTAPPDENQIRGFTYETIDKDEVRASWNGLDLVATVIVLVLTFGTYAYFSFWI